MNGGRGFTLVETVVALTLAGVLAMVVTRLMVLHQRLQDAQRRAVSTSETMRFAATVLPAELRALSAADGDLIAIDATSLTYRAPQTLDFLCRAPDGAELVLDRDLAFGIRRDMAAGDSALVFVEGDSLSPTDDTWLDAVITATAVGTECPGTGRSVRVTLGGLSGAQLAGLRAGDPVRTFRPTSVRLYRDAAGEWWLGVREFNPLSGSWAATQPFAGPVSDSGLVLEYLDSAGGPTTNPARVASVAIRVQDETSEPGGTLGARGLVTAVSLRGNPRPP